jgi:hypothetical protein
MKRPLFAATLALAALVPAGVNASELSYTWIEADYLDAGSDIDGFGLRGSIQFGQSGFYGLANYFDLDFDTPLGSADAQTWEVGVGYAHGLGSNIDLISELAHVDLEAVDGYRASVGVRGGFNERLEGLLKVNYRDLDCSFCDGDVTGTAGLQYKFTPAFGLLAEVEFGNGEEVWLAGARLSF